MAWSYGAVAALDFAVSHVDGVRSLVLIEPPALWALPNHGRAHKEVVQLERLIVNPADDVSEQMLETFLASQALFHREPMLDNFHNGPGELDFVARCATHRRSSLTPMNWHVCEPSTGLSYLPQEQEHRRSCATSSMRSRQRFLTPRSLRCLPVMRHIWCRRTDSSAT